ncbi:MAG: ZIP family metal transporter [Lachnospiraceae bacterium]|nr:ZIP family metal transporter [Lachnospiraceae bacterium]
MNGILYAFLGTLFTFAVTTLGALNVFWVRKENGHRMESMTLGFAGGVMIAASVWSLLLPGLERAEVLGQLSFLIIPVGFLAGVVLLLLADYALEKKEASIPIKRSTGMLVLSITAHNIPEGMAIGLAFALSGAEPGNDSLLSGAIALAIGVGIQNYPEGTAVALPLVQEGMSKKKAFFIGSMSAIVEPIFGVLAAVFAGKMLEYMPLFLAMAAGAMIYVVVEELIPEAHLDEDSKSGTLGFVVGFIVMMILDVALG